MKVKLLKKVRKRYTYRWIPTYMTKEHLVKHGHLEVLDHVDKKYMEYKSIRNFVLYLAAEIGDLFREERNRNRENRIKYFAKLKDITKLCKENR